MGVVLGGRGGCRGGGEVSGLLSTPLGLGGRGGAS